MNPVEIFKGTEIKISYLTSNQKLPFLVFTGSGTSPLIADDKNYTSDYRYTLEYYFDIKDEDKERRIEEILNEKHILWEKSEDVRIDSEKINVIYYNI